MRKTPDGLLKLSLALFLVLAFSLAGIAWASELQFKPLTPQRVERLNKEARQAYELGLAALDKVNYDKALENFMQASEKEPDNPHLRFTVVQIAHYLGDTRSGAESIKFYDLAALNLKAITESPKLNVREKQRAQQALELITSLRQAVLERDEKRVQFGRDIAKQYAKEIYKKDELEKEKAEKESRTKPKLGTSGEVGTTDQAVSIKTEGQVTPK